MSDWPIEALQILGYVQKVYLVILHKSEDANGSQDFAVLQIPSFSIALLNAINEMTTHKQQKLESNIYS